MWSTRLFFVLLGLMMVVSNNAQMCSNGLAGVDNSNVCCVAECGTCGGSGCGSRGQAVGLIADDCCVGRIRDANVYCDDSGAAPCIIGSDSICSGNGLSGLENNGVCCVAECPQCGGSGCGSEAQRVGLSASDCCRGPIISAGVLCDESGMAPCNIGEPSTCSNDVFGVEAGGACCVTQCVTCGGVGCSRRAATAGLTADDCCIGRIMDSDVFCDVSGTAPCIIDGPCGPALTITLEWSEPDSDLDLYVTEPDGSVVSFASMVGSVGFLDMDVRSGPGIETYTIFRFLDPNSLDIIGNYQYQARRFSGPPDTVFTLSVSLVDEEIFVDIGDFKEFSSTDFLTVPVTEYDSSCEDGTDAFELGSRDSTSSPEDKLP